MLPTPRPQCIEQSMEYLYAVLVIHCRINCCSAILDLIHNYTWPMTQMNAAHMLRCTCGIAIITYHTHVIDEVFMSSDRFWIIFIEDIDTVSGATNLAS